MGGLVAVVFMAKMERLIFQALCLLALLLPGIAPAHAQEVAIPPAEPAMSMQATGGEGNWWRQDIWKDPERGFYWYPPDRPPPKKEEAPKEAKKKEAPKKSIYEMMTSADVNAELKRLLDVAIFNPTEKNAYEYQRAKAYVLEKAAIFTDVGRRVMWQNADIDYNTKVPLASFGRNEMRNNNMKSQQELFANLSKTHGILFFYRSDCPYCHKQAPVLLELKKRHGIEVLAISLDNGPIPGFPDARPDNGISKFVTDGAGIQTVPAIFLVSNDKKTVVPIGSGLLAMEEVVERVQILTQTNPGDRF